MSADSIPGSEILDDLRTDSKTHTHQLESMDTKINIVVEQNLDDKIDRALERAHDKSEVAKAEALLEKASNAAEALLEKAANKATALLEEKENNAS